MELDLGWMLLGLPVAFALGWLASRMDIRQVRLENRRAPKAYFRGLNFLLNEQQDKAIDAFIEAMQADPDTAELHFALGNLFRRRGEYSRAVRVHEHLLARADLSHADHDRAQYALAQDFLKAGLLDRAEDALRRLEHSAHAREAHMALLAIYERGRDWAQARDIAAALHAAGHGDFAARQAHYLCEQAAQHLRQSTGPSGHSALPLLQQATATAPTALRPRLELARLQHQTGNSAAAWQTLGELAQASPHGLPLAAALIHEVAIATSCEAQAIALLRQHYQQHPSLDVLQALVDLCADPHGQGGDRCPDAQRAAECGLLWYARHLQHGPSLVIATRWLAAQTRIAPAAKEIKTGTEAATILPALEHAARPLSRYRCAACGFEARQHFWHCPGCQSWDSYPARRVEEL